MSTVFVFTESLTIEFRPQDETQGVRRGLGLNKRLEAFKGVYGSGFRGLKGLKPHTPES